MERVFIGGGFWDFTDAVIGFYLMNITLFRTSMDSGHYWVDSSVWFDCAFYAQ
jgi:hypothetical protein